MKPCRLLLVLAFCLLVTNSYAIRMPRIGLAEQVIKIQMEGDEKTSINGVVKACKDKDDCSTTTTGKFRKLMISTNSSPSTVPTTTISSKSPEKGASNVSPSLVAKSSSDVANKRKPVSSTPLFESEAVLASSQNMEYGDITEMDYSPAKRKPPIHN